MKVYIFPGQGSQARGMGEKLFDRFPELVDNADEILGYSIRELCLFDEEKKLGKTQYTQPALYVVNALSYYAKQENGESKPDFLAGHSLGEFSALLAAECYSFETGLKLVKKRGELMSKAHEGAMAAVLNVTLSEVEARLKSNKLMGIDIANYNSRTQIVLSGLAEEIRKAEAIFQNGDVKFYPLNTAGAFHSRFMRDSAKQFSSYLGQFKFSAPAIPVISNVTANIYDVNSIAQYLSNQMVSQVRWYESITYLLERANLESADVFFEEVGHGDVLSKIVSRIQEEWIHEKSLGSADGRAYQASLWQGSQTKLNTMNAEELVHLWNEQNPVGTKVKSIIMDYGELETKSRAFVLFGHRAAVYVDGYRGYFDLRDLVLV